MSKIARVSVVVTLLAASASARSDITVNFPLIDNSSVSQLNGYLTQDIQVRITNDWTTGGLVLNLTAGSIYQNSSQYIDGANAPPTILFDVDPSARYDTYVGIPGDVTGGSYLSAGEIGGTGFQFDTTRLETSWFNTATQNKGILPIGRLSLSSDAQGTLALAVTEADRQVAVYEFPVVNGRVIPDPVCDSPGDDGCGYDYVGLDDLDAVLTHWNQSVPSNNSSMGEYTGDGYVGLDDLDSVLSFWNLFTVVQTGPLQIVNPVDYDEDGFIGLSDIDLVLANWNQSSPPASIHADHDGNGYIGQDDLSAVVSLWNAGTPPTALPEPVSIVGLLMMTPLLLRRR